MASAAQPAQAVPQLIPKVTERYVALDAYRGFIMMLLVSVGLGFNELKGHPFWGVIANQIDHVEWQGLNFWDLIQPAFMFMVGVAMPFAIAKRVAAGAAFGDNFRHVAMRAIKLIVLSNILSAVSGGRWHFQLVNVLCQIAFAYFFTFLIMQLKFRWQAAAALGILALYWGLFAAFPGPEGTWSKTGNIGQVIDKAVLGYNYGGNYVTINFITSTVTVLFGAWAGMLFQSQRTRAQKMKIVAAWAVASILAGLALNPVIPIVKKIWTPSFTLYSAGWVLLMMLAFFWLIEIQGYKKFAFPMMVVGMNCIFIYSISQVLRGWIHRSVGVLFGNFTYIGTLAPVAQGCATLVVMWYLCYWMYKHKIFFKL